MGGTRALAALLLAAGTTSHAQSPADLAALIAKGDARAAYELGRRAPERLGQPEFDFLFGIAAIEAGHAAEGVLALERVLLLDPRNERARFELARGYFKLGEDARAREEFAAALAANPPPEAARAAAEYLAALREREARYKPTLSGFVEAGGGYDSNPRAGVDNPSITLPVLGDVTVADTGLRASDQTRQSAAGFRATLPVRGRVAAFAAGQAEVLRHREQADFDQELYAGSLGVLGQWGRQSWRAGASRGYQTLARLPYRHTEGQFVDWGWAPDERNALSAGVQAGRLMYHGGNQVRDSDFATLAIGWRRAFAMPGRPIVEASATYGRERNVNDDRQDLSRDLYGVRVGIAASPLADWTVQAGAQWQRSRYREADAILQTTRDDRYGAADVGVAWRVWGGLSIRAEYTEARNESNLALYEYRRRTAMLRGRYEFR